MDAPLIDRLQNHDATIGVVGLGYVGLPLILTFARQGAKLIGFDVDPAKVEMLARGEAYIRHLPATEIKALIDRGSFSPTTDFSGSATCDALLVCVPTPLGRNREPDMSYIEGTARSLGPHLRPGRLIVLESTTYPGTTEGILREVLEATSGLTAGTDFYLAYSPEREDPGNPSYDTRTIPKVVGGLTSACRDVAVALYESALECVIPVSSPAAAEACKLLENIFRSVNIALVNELKLVCERLGIDLWEVIDAAATKPFGFMPFYPGPGLGGHCIPIDPFYLTWKAREVGINTRFIELAGEINTAMPRHVVERTAEALNRHQKPVHGSRILVLGIAYKRDVDDVRESPAMPIIELLVERGAMVSYHDPFVPVMKKMRKYTLDLASVELTDEILNGSDAVLIVTDHTCVDYARVVAQAPLIIDTRNATRGVSKHRDRILKA